MAQNSNNTPNNITYRQMVGTFSDIATNHLQLQSFNSGSLNDLDIEKLDADKFPLLYITPKPATVDAQTLMYSFDVVVADQIQEDMADIDDTYSETLLIIKDVISNFRHYSPPCCCFSWLMPSIFSNKLSKSSIILRIWFSSAVALLALSSAAPVAMSIFKASRINILA